MKISYKTDYALKTMLDIAQHSFGDVVNISDISERQDIPKKFLVQILQILKNAGLITSKRGPDGGYLLSSNSEKISLGQIVRLFEGHLSPITCVSKSCYTHCNYEKTCPFREVWKEIRDLISSKLDNISIKDMCEKEKELKGKNVLEYMI